VPPEKIKISSISNLIFQMNWHYLSVKVFTGILKSIFIYPIGGFSLIAKKYLLI